MQQLDCDFLACSSYKFFGPHMGVLWGRRAILDDLAPYKCRCSSNGLPERFELGTPQIELMAGLSAAVGYFEELGAGVASSRRQKIAAAKMDLAAVYTNEFVKKANAKFPKA